MARLRGHVDRADKMLLSGWAMDEDHPEVRPLVQVMQRGQVVAATRVGLPLPQLRASLSLPPAPQPPLYGWQIALPLASGILPGLPFSVVVVGADGPMGNGQDLTIRAVEHIDPEARADLEGAPLVQLEYQVQAEGIRFSLRATRPDETVELVPMAGRQRPHELEARPAPSFTPLVRRALRFTGRIPRPRLERAQRLALPLRLRFAGDEADTRLNFHHRLRTQFFPRSLYDETVRRLPVPDAAAIQRVSGPSSDLPRYLVGGMTTFLQLDALTRRLAGRAVTEFPCVVDWGVGCARVLRHFVESAPGLGLPPPPEGRRLVGLDVDAVNLEWCRSRLGDVAEFGQLDPAGRFDLPNGSVDLLYGISVMTHLTEFHQHLWLSEIRRVLRPGGLAILTVRGEMAYFRQAASLALPFVERFGIFDGLADATIGMPHYRSTSLSRGYIRAMWRRYLEILEIVPAATNSFQQDYVVLRRREG